eukprot:365344-Chlamydomonas_euryale.AAC.3
MGLCKTAEGERRMVRAPHTLGTAHCFAASAPLAPLAGACDGPCAAFVTAAAAAAGFSLSLLLSALPALPL